MKWSLFKFAAKPEPPRRGAMKPAQSKYHAVEIVSPSVCCAAARQASEVRFLSSEQPPALPLAACEFPAACLCRYRHHDDRRSMNRRASDQVWGASSSVPAERERRRSVGRRATDQQASS